MKSTKDRKEHSDTAGDPISDDLLPAHVRTTAHLNRGPLPHAVIGQLIGIKDEGRTPLVLFPGRIGSAAVVARTVVDLHQAHIGRDVVLCFDEADPTRPIILGVMRGGDGWPLDEKPGQIEVEPDGERLIVSAKTELVLRCGQASITLTRSGKVFIQGTYVSSRSTTVNRIRGGSVQIN
jgi:Domain of unknown function (DUF6484)